MENDIFDKIESKWHNLLSNGEKYNYYFERELSFGYPFMYKKMYKKIRKE